MHELGEWDAVETAERLRKKDVSRLEVIEAAITRAEAAAKLGAIVTQTFDSARTATSGGLLAGVPTFIKDLAQVEGVRTSWGSRGAGHYVAKRTDPTIQRFFGTGLVSLGKSATPEFGLTATTEPNGFPPCRNPWDPTRSVGGSSGGAGCLVAAGVVPVAHASDGGGSIRIPAACNGLVGLKPTRKRFDMEGSNLLPINVAVQGVVSRSVRDTVAFYAALESGGSPIPPVGPLPPHSRLRVGLFVTAPSGTPVDAQHRAAVDEVGMLLESLGHHVDAIACPFEAQFVEDFLRFWGFIAFTYARAGKVLTHRGFDARQLSPWARGLSEHFTEKPRLSFDAVRRLRRFGAAYATVMQRYDVLLCPTLGEPPPLLGHLSTELAFEVNYERLIRFTPFTAPANVAGAPAISLPLARTTTGLPIGIQLAAAPGRDALLLSLALQLEEAKPWPLTAPRDAWQ